MLGLLSQGHYGLFALILFAIVLSLTLHEFGHAWMANKLGDDTAERAGRLTLNPVTHIDPVGLIMVVVVGFGYAKPVPVTPGNLRPAWGQAAVAAAGPAMNLLISVVAINVLVWGLRHDAPFVAGEAQVTLLFLLAQINLLLMLFNLLPLGPLDGHYVMAWLLPPRLKWRYEYLNQRYGAFLFLGLIGLSLIGVPVFRWLLAASEKMLPLITFV